jgi:putative ABC transport system permease protein
MVPVARRNLLAEKTRFCVAVGGVAFAVFLIVIIWSVYQGLRDASNALISDIPADVWVLQEGTADLFHSSSEISEDLDATVEDIPGVRSVQKVIGRSMRYQADGHEGRSLFLAFDTQGSLRIASQGDDLPRQQPDRGEIIAAADIAGVGETVTLADREFTVVDTHGKTGVFGSYSFLNFEDARGFLAAPDEVSYLLVNLNDPSQTEAMASIIGGAVSGVEVLTSDEFAQRNSEDMNSFLPVIMVLVVIGFVVGVAVISLTIYTATIEKSRDFGILKALGASNRDLYRMVVSQSFAVGVLGFVTGVPLALGAGRIISMLVPQFLTLFQWQAILAVLLAVVVMSVLASYLPVRRIANIEPAAVFRA